MKTLDQLKNLPGTYILALEVREHIIIEVKLLQWSLNLGFYLYFGSAKGKHSTSLKNRIIRHFNPKKTIFWHIDHLTTHPAITLHRAYLNMSRYSSECQNLAIFSKDTNFDVITRFGSSDCSKKCGGHLGYIPGDNIDLLWIDDYFKHKKWEIVRERNVNGQFISEFFLLNINHYKSRIFRFIGNVNSDKVEILSVKSHITY